MPAPAAARKQGATPAQVDAVMNAARVLAAVVAESVTEVEDVVTMPQLRALVLVSTRGPLDLTAVAESLGVHPSNATRTCDRLVEAGLLDRKDSAADRRRLHLELTDHGRELVESVMTHRRVSIERVLSRMAPGQRRTLAPALQAFAAAAGEVPDDGTWSR